MDSYRHIAVTRQGDVFCVRLVHTRLEENEIYQLGEEILSLCHQHGCRQLALSLGPGTPYCLYSVFLAKLVAIKNALARMGGKMVLCDVGDNAYSTFEASHLISEFEFLPDLGAALVYFRQRTREPNAPGVEGVNGAK